MRSPPAPEGVIVATKGGLIRCPDGSRRFDGSPRHLRAACEASLRRLGWDRIDLYQLHRPDPEIPLAESLGELGELQDEGKVASFGVGNVTSRQLLEAELPHQTHERLRVAQVAFNLWEQGARTEAQDLADLGLKVLGYGVFGGADQAPRLGEHAPGAAILAARLGVSVHEVVLAWCTQATPVIPLFGARTTAHVRTCLGGTTLRLTGGELGFLERGWPTRSVCYDSWLHSSPTGAVMCRRRLKG
jgi:aryl-alcohol dehydrogenase-like predicted oxidoreductase